MREQGEERLRALLQRGFEQPTLVVGDFFLDRYLNLERRLSETSLETGLEAYQVVSRRCTPGAAGSVAANLRSLGAHVTALGMVGEDGNGFELEQALERLGVTRQLIQTPSRMTPTYTKPMMRERDGRVHELNRLDVKNRQPLPTETESAIIRRLRGLFPQMRTVLVVDQVQEAECGVITTPVRQALCELASAHPEVTMVVDSRERIGLFEHACTKPNQRELLLAVAPELVEENETLSLDTLGELAAQLWDRTGHPVFLTLAERGMLVVTEAQRIHLPAIPVEGEIDPVGAGDSAISGIALALSAGATLKEAAMIGSLVASVTIKQLGTTGTASPAQVMARYLEMPTSFS